jgi:uncharacterized caspase-like protein
MGTSGKTESKKALLIGVSEYVSFPNLKFCENDARKMAKVLGDQAYDVVNLVGKVKWQEMRRAIRNFFLAEGVNPKDTLFFYFSGHGVSDRFGKNHYLASSEIDPHDPGDRGFWFNELDETIENSISQRKVTVLDCCYAGALGSIGITKGSVQSKKMGEEKQS